jgi:hypothetical protein
VSTARTILVGDAHGCAAELEELLDRVAFSAGLDRVLFVGDLVARGPDTHGVLAMARGASARSVLGNHEAKLLAWKRRGGTLGPDHERLARELSDDDWRMLEAMPLWLELPEHGVLLVHAGVVPGVDVGRCPPDALLKMRTIDSDGRWSDDAQVGPLWGTVYTGPPHVVFGHHAREELQVHPWATGLDTSCVYGGKLTALVLDEGEPIPRGSDVRGKVTSVAARRAYYRKPKKGEPE